MAEAEVDKSSPKKKQAESPKPAAGPKARKPKKKRRRGAIAIVAILALLVIGAIAMVMSRGGEQGMSVEIEQVSRRTIVQTVSATGVIQPETQLKISSEVSGEIIYLPFKEGDMVQKGQVIVRINPETMVAQLDQARAGISGAQARVSQVQANLLRAEQDLARLQQLMDKNLATRQELEVAQTNVKVNQAELDASQFQVKQAQANYRQMQESVNKTTIVAPMSGTITKLNSKIGEKVVGAIQMAGTEIMTIADLSVIEAVVDVSETDVVQVSLGDVAEVEVDAIPGEKFRAIVSAIANSPKQQGALGQAADQLTNFEVKLRFVNPDHRFRPGMTATAEIQTARTENILAVPIQSVTTRDEESTKIGPDAEEDGVTNVKLDKEKKEEAKPIVFVKVGDSVVTRSVTTGIRDDQYMEIVGGLKPGDQVVIGSYKAISKDLEGGSKVFVSKTKTETKKK